MNDKGSDAAEGEIITLSQAGKILNASYATVRRLAVAADELKGFRLRNSWRTSTTACEEYIKRQFDEQAVICRSTDER